MTAHLPIGRKGPRETGGLRRVHVGCGPENLLPDWWNVDLRGFPGIDEVADVTQPWPWSNLEFVYGEHFLEHLPLELALDFLSHAGRALQSGGVIRLSTPNLEWVMATHYGAGGSDRPRRVADTIATNRAFHGWGHHFLYSQDMLAHVLGEMGFESISFHAYGESDEPALRGLERHGELEFWGTLASVVIVEARPGQAKVQASARLLAMLEADYLSHVRSGH